MLDRMGSAPQASGDFRRGKLARMVKDESLLFGGPERVLNLVEGW